MGKRVILTLLEGSFEQGFPVILRIGEDGTVADTGIQILGKLPPALNILELFNNWQLAYYHTVMPHSRIRPKPAQVTNFSCHQLGSDLALQMNKWLNSEFREWQKIRDGLQRHLNDNDEIHVVLETEDIALRRLPWHLWNLFSSHYTKAEFVLGAPEHYSSKGRRISRSKKIRILAILGDSTGIDIQKDRAMLEQLPYAKTSFLVEPERQALYNQLWEEQWKIIFFAGHSWSAEDDGSNKIYINRQDSLSIAELKEALRNAIENGLQLAIFNSCNGLGLAQELADLHIPQVIIMREPVPDLVAQEFLKHFLTSFTRGKSLYLAVREARERLQSLERQ
ncbi:MAG: CHAT domain-containing protein, partial [Chroococcidiopsidaceae cyanobacterium CP_BM_RX_35]|nr:CHAT domain-containing protein [Chroococcidiopsidaceae cyanobacterium CP_BM_RX_35]